MILVTKAIEAKLAKAPLYSTEKLGVAPVIVKFFTPWSNWTWYAIEGTRTEDGDWEFFGLVEGHQRELGYFLLSELQSIRGIAGLYVERDRHFEGYAVDKITNEVKRIAVAA